MSGMMERVARVLSLNAEGTDICWLEFMGAARAAVEAMRLPTERMEKAGYAAIGPINPLPVYTRMVDAALEERL